MIKNFSWLIIVLCLQGCIKGGNKASPQSVGDSLIVLVNIGTYRPEEIAKGLQIINNQGPSVVAIDKPLSHLNSKFDSSLASAIGSLEKVVLLAEIDSTGNVEMPHPNYIHLNHWLGTDSFLVYDNDVVKSYYPLYETDSFPTMQILNFAEEIAFKHHPLDYDAFNSMILMKETPIRFFIEPKIFSQCDLRHVSSLSLTNKIVILGDLRKEQDTFNVVIKGRVHKTNSTVIYANIILNRFQSMWKQKRSSI